jgi:hypothetical protein
LGFLDSEDERKPINARDWVRTRVRQNQDPAELGLKEKEVLGGTTVRYYD